MPTGRFVFSELISHLPPKEFQKCVTRYGGDRHRRSFSCWDQYLSMAFAQLTYRQSLRDIEACLGSMQSKLSHLGFRGKVARSTLADANETVVLNMSQTGPQGLIFLGLALIAVRHCLQVTIPQRKASWLTAIEALTEQR